jgi:hypothetical protein
MPPFISDVANVWRSRCVGSKEVARLVGQLVADTDHAARATIAT